MNYNRSNAQEFLGEMSPAGQRAQQVLTPYQQFRVSGSVVPPSQSYDIDPIAELDGLDPADDLFLDNARSIINQAPDALRDPYVQGRVKQAAAQHAEAQAYFKKDPTLADFYAQQRAQNIPPQEAMSALRNRALDNSTREGFLKAGGLDEEYESLRDPATGQVDRFKAMSYLNKFERDAKRKVAAAPKELTAEGYNRLLSAEDALEAAKRVVDLSPENKTAVFKKEFKRAPKTQEDWDRAHELVNKDVRAAQDRFEGLRQAYGSRYVLPPEYAPVAEAPVETQETLVEASPEGSIMEGAQSVVPALPGAVEAPVDQPAPTGYVQPTPTPVAVPSPAKTAPKSQQKPAGIQQEDRASFLSRQKGKG